MAQSHFVKVLDHFQISPPLSSVLATSLPLTFFDMPWLLCRPMQRLFFYEFPHSTLHFMNSILPSLKNSLSLTLKHFFPLAANLTCPPPPHKPYILFTEGEDSIPFTVAESMVDFDYVISNHARDVRELHPLVPKLHPTRVTSDGTRVMPLLALQVVLFPNSGICIGAQFSHVVADGMAFNHFMKSWALVFRSNGDLTCLDNSLPSHNRAMIKDPCEFESIFLKEWWDSASSWDKDLGSTESHDNFADKVRATFVIGQPDIQRLKDLVLNQCMEHSAEQLHVSTFVVTCAFIWVSLIISQETEVGVLFENDKLYHLSFVADCRHRLDSKLPTTYFGNCLDLCYVSVKRSELLGDNGIVIAAKAIGKKVKELESGVLIGAEKWMSNWKEMSECGKIITVAGSPKLRVYDTDFGWGKPKKSEVVQIDASGAIYLSESRDGFGKIEVGLALTRSQMEVFIAIFEQGLKQNME